MRGLVYVLIGFALLAGIFLLIWLYRSGDPSREQLGLRVEDERSEQASPSPIASPSPSPTSSPIPADEPEPSAGVVESAPLTSRIREEVRENPHATPPSLVRFSRVMAARMERAMEDFDEAEGLFPELESCVQQLDRSSSARVVCLNNAERLAKAFPVLMERYEELRVSSPEEIRKLHQAMGVLAGKSPARGGAP